MILLPAELRAALRANDTARRAADARGERFDPVPVLKLFNPLGAATWLATELAEDEDTLFGLADLGFGCPELGVFSLSEIASVRLPLVSASSATSRSMVASGCPSGRRGAAAPGPSSGPRPCCAASRRARNPTPTRSGRRPTHPATDDLPGGVTLRRPSARSGGTGHSMKEQDHDLDVRAFGPAVGQQDQHAA